ncbi:MAG TPA: SAF domain-containing protein [Solirubrobacterales bacterium]|nr:SAF domain-containing protein [Solirubrobacterales bacterium]
MSRRRRALAFLLAALLAAAGAAAIADGYGAGAVRGYGPLRPVVVVSAAVPAGQRFVPPTLAASLSTRRVPSRFVPPDALAMPGEALGLVARAPLPAGSYLLAAQLGVDRRGKPQRRSLGAGRRPVEIEISGADALLATGRSPTGSRVDVVVTTEPSGSGPGRTYVAAPGVPLLALRDGAEGAGPGTTAAATLGLTRREALRLIAAESFARKLTLLPDG